MPRQCFRIIACCVLLAAANGCQWEPSRHVAPAEAPAIPISHPVQREVTDYVDFTGRTDAIQAVDIRPRAPAI